VKGLAWRSRPQRNLWISNNRVMGGCGDKRTKNSIPKIVGMEGKTSKRT